MSSSLSFGKSGVKGNLAPALLAEAPALSAKAPPGNMKKQTQKDDQKNLAKTADGRKSVQAADLGQLADLRRPVPTADLGLPTQTADHLTRELRKLPSLQYDGQDLKQERLDLLNSKEEEEWGRSPSFQPSELLREIANLLFYLTFLTFNISLKVQFFCQLHKMMRINVAIPSHSPALSTAPQKSKPKNKDDSPPGMRRGIVETILPPLVETRSLPPASGSVFLQAFQPQRGSISSTEGSKIISEGAEAETEESVLSDDYDVMLKFLEEMEEADGDDNVEEDGLPERSKEFTTADGGGGYNFNRYSRPPLADLPATVAAFFQGATPSRRRNDQGQQVGDSRFPYPYLVPPPEPYQRDPLQIGAQPMFQQKFAGGSGLVDVPGRRQQQQLAGQLAGQLESADRPLAPAFKTIDVDREAGYDTHLAAHNSQSHLLNIIPDRPGQDTERYGAGGSEKGKQSAGSKGGGESSRDPGTRKAALTLAQLSSRLSAPPPPPPPVSGLSSSRESSAAGAPVREERVIAFLLKSPGKFFLLQLMVRNGMIFLLQVI